MLSQIRQGKFRSSYYVVCPVLYRVHSLISLSRKLLTDVVLPGQRGAERNGSVVIDGQVEPEYDGIGDITFSLDGKHVAYGARRNKWFVSNKWFVVVDSQVGSEYDGIGDIFFSPDGKHVAYGARRNKWLVNKWFVVVDGQAGPEYDGIGDITFSLDGKHLAYGARRSKWLVNKWFVVVDSQPGPEYDGIVCGPIFLKDGIVEYIAMKGGSLYRVNVMP